MTTPHSRFGNTRVQICLLCATAFLAWARAYSQQTVPPTESYVRIGREFLRTLYPELNGKKYTVTLETSLSYDDPVSAPKFFMLDVGAGAKYAVIDCCIGGEMGTVVMPASPMPYPPELGPPPSPPPAPPLPKPKKRKQLNVDAHGAVHPDQYLSTRFLFNSQGQLESFTAEGPSITDREADEQLYESLRAHPGLTNAGVADLLKESGARYGLDDEKKFTHDLPIKQLEPFLGKLRVLSVSYPQPTDGNPAKLPIWLYCEVSMLATRRGGTKLKYEAIFDHYRGALTDLHAVPPTRGTSQEKPASNPD